MNNKVLQNKYYKPVMDKKASLSIQPLLLKALMGSHVQYSVGFFFNKN